MGKKRSPMQVSDDFENALKNIQVKFMKQQGKNISLRELTERIAKSEDFQRIEENLLKGTNMDLRIKLDRRLR